MTVVKFIAGCYLIKLSLWKYTQMPSYLSPKVKKGFSRIGGEGLFAADDISAGETVIDYTDHVGQYVSSDKWKQVLANGLDYDIQVGDDLFLVAGDSGEVEDADFLNHSCDPNCGVKDKVKIVALKGIGKGEEITFDYAMSESYDYKMYCHCGRTNCRKIITGADWRLKELQDKYKGFFSEYLNDKIRIQ